MEFLMFVVMPFWFSFAIGYQLSTTQRLRAENIELHKQLDEYERRLEIDR